MMGDLRYLSEQDLTDIETTARREMGAAQDARIYEWAVETLGEVAAERNRRRRRWWQVWR